MRDHQPERRRQRQQLPYPAWLASSWMAKRRRK
jgi:hypothetical protein